ncbi:MAG: YihA family ribosome biogenesis GTP-binding protein [Nitrospinaceae bacterium]|nr:YihA family ribosome biogenesis GTP-binding protein [Nitrospinaceae bacterium]NIR53529.1 YihA family ribosome biogenesis GTP-binding protein [Nitrospinaceae bacterium]NIS83930.1 YihA family ribosome biogenesis GTP-binding protein [Nitrospinaceae bacterium]NIT80739.1 YihA family ribosome biogenesis GTP-binding protein [Nitrospinaceae bacterium]NIU43045.1 YihA family ribosome biogenesis GTP-binding protein [Nitrospinaceae bacterium]
MKITQAEFIISAVSAKQYPAGHLPEFAFVGRSNVGKSSLINSLLNRKKLVKTSATPGKTQMINFFNINGDLIFADLPGYGFAKVPPAVQKKWQALVENYLIHRENLRAVVLLIDIRRKPTELDLHMQEWLEQYEVDYILAATKADKLSQAEQSQQLKLIRAAFLQDRDHELIAYSSKTHRGRKELWKQLTRRMKDQQTETA